jgi:hypothetical protein
MRRDAPGARSGKLAGMFSGDAGEPQRIERVREVREAQ